MTKISNKKNKLSIDKAYIHAIEPKISITEFEFCNIDLLKKMKDSFSREIAIQDLLEYYEDKYILQILNEIISKLQDNGKLHIQGLDIKSLCNSVASGQIDILTFKTLLLSSGKKNFYSVLQIKSILKNIPNIEITKIKFMNGLQYYLECTKKSHI